MKTTMFKSLVTRSKRYTTDHNLALEVSKLSGKLPIEHISPRIREGYAKAYPELLRLPEEEQEHEHDKEMD
ncbi:MAG: hypothetical protein HZA08_07310 [Nitrospirae bacterium]|nr:hypothetical protein [Nitrospirota bacterium]